MSGSFTLSTCVAAAGAVVRGFATVVQGIAFWTAALLPLVYVPLLFVDLGVVDFPVAIEAMVGLHVVALVVGHGYRGDVVEEFDRHT